MQPLGPALQIDLMDRPEGPTRGTDLTDRPDGPTRGTDLTDRPGVLARIRTHRRRRREESSARARPFAGPEPAGRASARAETRADRLRDPAGGRFDARGVGTLDHDPRETLRSRVAHEHAPFPHEVFLD